MKKIFRSGLRLRLSLYITLPVVIASLIFAFFVSERQTKLISDEIVAKGMSLGSAFYGVAANNVLNDKFYTLEEGFQTVLKSNHDVKYLILMDSSGKIFAHSDSGQDGKVLTDSVSKAAAKAANNTYTIQTQPNGEQIYDISVPINVDLEKWGVLRIGISNAEARTEIARSRNFAFGLAVALALAGIVIAYLLSRNIIKPIRAMVDKMNEIAAGNFTGEIVNRANDETGLLAQAVNTMLGNVRNLIAEVKEAGQKVASASDELGGYSGETFSLTEQVAEAIEKVAGKNNEQAADLQDTVFSIQQLNQAIGQIAAGAAEQAHHLTKTSSLVNEMAAAIRELAVNAASIEETAAKTSEVAENGVQTVARSVNGMNSIRVTVFETSDKLKDLASDSEKIGEIVQVISEIAEQTNLLALNAAIEAARAGEYGKGFAVVADEVRKLAERSGSATREISSLVENIQKGTERCVSAMEESIAKVEEGTELSGQATGALQEIIDRINQSNTFMQHISGGAEVIAGNSDQIVSSIENLAAIAEENSASTEEMSAGSDQANQVITKIADGVEETAGLSENVSSSTRQLVNTSQEIASSAVHLGELAGGLQRSISKFTI